MEIYIFEIYKVMLQKYSEIAFLFLVKYSFVSYGIV
jgi:hypothetical protein